MSDSLSPKVLSRPRTVSMAGVVRAGEHGAAVGFGTLLALLAIVALDDTRGIWTCFGVVAAGGLLPALVAFTFPGWVLTTRRTMVLGCLVPTGLFLPLADSLVFPRPLDVGGAWGILALSLTFAAVCNEMLWLGVLLHDCAESRPWIRRAAPALALLPFLALWGIFAEQRHPSHDSRMELAANLVTRLWENYPHWNQSPVTPWQLWAKYRPLLEEADRACGEKATTCDPYLRTLRDMFAELRNGHTEILLENDLGMTAVRVEQVEGRAVITRVEPGSDAEDAGLRAGNEVLAVDGRTIEDALRRVPAWRLSFTSARMRAYAGYSALLDGPAANPVGITVRSGEASTRVVRLERSPVRYDAQTDASESTAIALGPVPATDVTGFSYAHLEGFEDEEVTKHFDSFLDASLKSPGLILDLRENYGGMLDHAFHVLGRLLPEPLVIGEHCAPGGADGDPCTVHRIEPLAPVYQGPVAVIIDENVYSAAELVAYALCRTGRAKCFGRATAGETDCVFRFDLPGGAARVSWADFRPAFGPTLLGDGVEPDVSVERNLADVRARRDAPFESALAWVQGEASRLAAGTAPALAPLAWRSKDTPVRHDARASATPER